MYILYDLFSIAYFYYIVLICMFLSISLWDDSGIALYMIVYNMQYNI